MLGIEPRAVTDKADVLPAAVSLQSSPKWFEPTEEEEKHSVHGGGLFLGLSKSAMGSAVPPTLLSQLGACSHRTSGGWESLLAVTPYFPKPPTVLNPTSPHLPLSKFPQARGEKHTQNWVWSGLGVFACDPEFQRVFPTAITHRKFMTPQIPTFL